MSDPVAPPPTPEGYNPPPANQGFGAAPTPGGPPQGQPGYPPQGQPGYPQQGQPGYPQQGQPGYPQQGFGDAPAAPAPAKKTSGAGRIILRIGAAVLVGVAILGVKIFFFSATDKAKDAAVGDCIASSKEVKGEQETEASAKVVDCTSADAAYTVVGRVNGETDVKSKSCDKFFKENEEFFVYAADNGATGYLLCLRPRS